MNWYHYCLIVIITLLILIVYNITHINEYMTPTPSSLDPKFIAKELTLDCMYNNKKYYLAITNISNCLNLQTPPKVCLNNLAVLQPEQNAYTGVIITKSLIDNTKFRLVSNINPRPYLNTRILGEKKDNICFDNGHNNLLTIEGENGGIKLRFGDKYIGVCGEEKIKCGETDFIRLCLVEADKALVFGVKLYGTEHFTNDTIDTTSLPF